MKNLKLIRGPRFPEDYLVKMFFKEKLNNRIGRVLEFGCCSGNNLKLFTEFDWTAVGLDISAEALEDGRWNFNNSEAVSFIKADIGQSVPKIDGSFDAILMPNINCYIPRLAFENLLDFCKEKLNKNGIFYIRARTPRDWRFGKGEEVEKNGFILELTETGEQGLLNVFYEKNELLDLIKSRVGPLINIQVLETGFENSQNGQVIYNHDVIIWGRLP